MYTFMAITAVMTAGLMYALHLRERGGVRFGLWRFLERTISVYLILTMTLAVGLQALVRYASLHDFLGVPWADELSRLMLVWLVFLGAAVLQRSDEHIAMPLLIQRLPRNWRRAARLLGDVATIVLLVVLIRYGLATARSSMRMTALALPWPAGVFNLAVPVSAAIMLAFTVRHVYLRLRLIDVPADEVIEEY